MTETIKCKHCGETIAKQGREWRHSKTGFWKCLTTHAEPMGETPTRRAAK